MQKLWIPCFSQGFLRPNHMWRQGQLSHAGRGSMEGQESGRLIKPRLAAQHIHDGTASWTWATSIQFISKWPRVITDHFSRDTLVAVSSLTEVRVRSACLALAWQMTKSPVISGSRGRWCLKDGSSRRTCEYVIAQARWPGTGNSWKLIKCYWPMLRCHTCYSTKRH